MRTKVYCPREVNINNGENVTVRRTSSHTSSGTYCVCEFENKVLGMVSDIPELDIQENETKNTSIISSTVINYNTILEIEMSD